MWMILRVDYQWNGIKLNLESYPCKMTQFKHTCLWVYILLIKEIVFERRKQRNTQRVHCDSLLKYPHGWGHNTAAGDRNSTKVSHGRGKDPTPRAITATAVSQGLLPGSEFGSRYCTPALWYGTKVSLCDKLNPSPPQHLFFLMTNKEDFLFHFYIANTRQGTDEVAYQANPLPIPLASSMGDNVCPGCSISNLAPSFPEKVWRMTQMPCTHTGDGNSWSGFAQAQLWPLWQSGEWTRDERPSLSLSFLCFCK